MMTEKNGVKGKLTKVVFVDDGSQVQVPIKKSFLNWPSKIGGGSLSWGDDRERWCKG